MNVSAPLLLTPQLSPMDRLPGASTEPILRPASAHPDAEAR
jgi:hypothetical protein